MPVIPKFVVTAGPDGLNALMDLNINGALDTHPLAGVKGQFTPNLKPGLYPIGGGMYLIGPIDFIIDAAGKLNGDSGIELPASVDGVANLQWTISFNRAYLNGKLLNIPEWTFDTREAGETVPLENLMAVKGRAGAWLGIGRPASNIADLVVTGGTQLVFTRDDSFSLPAVTVPSVSDVLASSVISAAALAMTFG